jgi:N-methylhydantoinase B
VKILMPGGGGYGPADQRDRALVRRDVEEGFVSAEAARTLYGLEDA